jgi:class 3 adenylate cyclase/tRNA A-37 threonylcarbamoyl transferase component Bud32/tetratricopeptide (TPR) repeat protein
LDYQTSLSPQPPTPPNGPVMGRYQIDKELGRGGFGVVYLAHDTQLHDKAVVIKVLHERADTDRVRKDFEQEIRALARINHPGVLPILDRGFMPNGQPALVLQYVDGVTLRDVLRPSGIALRRASEIIRQVSSGLSAAHDLGITHRDLKPENILLREQGQGDAVIIDFGIAAISTSQTQDFETTSKRLKGTVCYMSPEQLLGSPSRHSDIFALGVIAYEMVTGQRPFEAPTATAMYVEHQKGLQIKPRDLRPELPRAAEDCILRALIFEPERRYTRARDFGIDLVSAMNAESFGPRRFSAASDLHMAAILFLDIVDYSKQTMERQRALLAKMDNTVRQTSAYQRAHAANGLLTLPTGDGMALVFFTNPVDPIESALEVCRRLREHPEMQLRMGIHIGPVFQVPDINAKENVAGGGINLAQRVMDCGDAGHILLSRSVADALIQISDGWLEKIHDLGIQRVKHGHELHLFNLFTGDAGNPRIPSRLRVHEPAAGLSRPAGPSAGASSPDSAQILDNVRGPIGRERERSELRSAFHAAVSGRGLLMVISGEPGLGKTTLVEEFLRGLKADEVPHYAAYGRCAERLTGAEAWLPVLEALDGLMHEDKQMARLVELVAPNWYRQKGSQLVDAASPAVPGRDVLAGSQERLKREFVQLLIEASLLRPFILFIDDVHWADLSTVDLIAHLVRRIVSLRVLVIVTFRPTDLILANHPFLNIEMELQTRGLCREIAVSFLSVAEIEDYLEAEYPGHTFPKKLAEILYSRTEGNPLFLVELVRDLRYRGAITLEEEKWRLSRTISVIEAELPQSIRSLIDSKILKLSDNDRMLLTAAAVQGQEFDSAVLARALSLDPAEVEDRLDKLDRVHSLVRALEAREFPDHTVSLPYRFVHSLYYDALSHSLRPARRAQLSSQIASALEAFHQDQSPQEAGHLAILYEAARNHQKAAEYFLIAARYSVRIFAHHEAIALARRGLGTLQNCPDTPERAKVELTTYMTLGGPLMATRGYADPEISDVFTRALKLCRRLGSDVDILPVLAALSAFHFIRAELDAGQRVLDELQREDRISSDPRFRVWVHFAQGSILSHVGKPADALQHFELALSYCEDDHHPWFSALFGVSIGVMARLQAGRTLWLLGRPDSALQQVSEALAQARKLAHPPTIAYALFFTSLVHHFRCEPRQTLELSDEAVSYAGEHGIQQVAAWAASLSGWARADMGDLEQGIATMRRALERQGTIHVALLRPKFSALLGQALMTAGRKEEGRQMLESAIAESKRTGEIGFDGEIYRLLGESSAQPAEAEKYFEQALDTARAQQALIFELRAARSLHLLRQVQGSGAETAARLSDLYGRFTEGHATSDLQQVKSVLISAAASTAATGN